MCSLWLKYKLAKPYAAPEAIAVNSGYSIIEYWAGRLMLAASIVLIILSMSEVIHVNAKGYFVGFVKNFGDLPLHIHYITSFLFGDNFPPKDPIFAGIPLRYPFLSDFYSSILWYGTKSMETALELPGMVLGAAFIVFFSQWINRLTASSLAGYLATVLFLLDGGMGWVYWIRDALSGAASASYTMIEQKGFYWSNVIYTLFVPQRSLQFAVPLVVVIIALTLRAAKMQNNKAAFLFISFLAAGAPFIHAHCVIVLSVFFILIFFFYPSRAWLFLIVPLCVFWTPQVVYLSSLLSYTGKEGGFIRFNLGWMSDGWGILRFWLMNAGVAVVLQVLAFFKYYKAKRDIYILALGGAFLFLIANVLDFAPWEWDNIKLFIFWYLFTVPMVSLYLTDLFKSGSLCCMLVSALLVLSLTFAGALDIHKALKKGGEDHLIFSADDIEIALWIKENTPKEALFLSAPTYNQPIALTGRKLFLGYPGHIFSHGINGSVKSEQVKIMSKGIDNWLYLLRRFNINYVIYGHREEQYGFNKERLDTSLASIAETDTFEIYSVSSQ
ncbi:hypothetical protein MCHI_001735 [Candidatus Magnetoovum chiemensis]|nr:hypothetical protein MCHI_001735 [Candidatus Magnetoovum chiemensis]